jgi:hypothetical protein
VEGENLITNGSQPVLLAVVVFSNPHKREELWGCPDCLYLVDKKNGPEIGDTF